MTPQQPAYGLQQQSPYGMQQEQSPYGMQQPQSPYGMQQQPTPFGSQLMHQQSMPQQSPFASIPGMQAAQPPPRAPAPIMPAARATFAKYDLDGDGSITMQEMVQYLSYTQVSGVSGVNSYEKVVSGQRSAVSGQWLVVVASVAVADRTPPALVHARPLHRRLHARRQDRV